jgi:hypothetical protein
MSKPLYPVGCLVEVVKADEDNCLIGYVEDMVEHLGERLIVVAASSFVDDEEDSDTFGVDTATYKLKTLDGRELEYFWLEDQLRLGYRCRTKSRNYVKKQSRLI